MSCLQVVVQMLAFVLRASLDVQQNFHGIANVVYPRLHCTLFRVRKAEMQDMLGCTVGWMQFVAAQFPIALANAVCAPAYPESRSAHFLFPYVAEEYTVESTAIVDAVQERFEVEDSRQKSDA